MTNFDQLDLNRVREVLDGPQHPNEKLLVVASLYAMCQAHDLNDPDTKEDQELLQEASTLLLHWFQRAENTEATAIFLSPAMEAVMVAGDSTQHPYTSKSACHHLIGLCNDTGNKLALEAFNITQDPQVVENLAKIDQEFVRVISEVMIRQDPQNPGIITVTH